MSSYRYSEPTDIAFSPLPEGEYAFIVEEAGEPYKSDKGNLVLALKLLVGPEQVPVFDNPSQGTGKKGPYDSIARFLKAVGRAPAPGTEPNWKRLVGAKGRAHIKIEIAQQGKLAGKEVNKVGWYIYADSIRQTKDSTQPPARQNFSPAEVKQSQDAVNKAAGHDPDLDVEPDDIPF
jgi:hypothetical protein